MYDVRLENNFCCIVRMKKLQYWNFAGEFGWLKICDDGFWTFGKLDNDEVRLPITRGNFMYLKYIEYPYIS